MDQVEELCRLARQGDREAASELVTMSYERVYAYFRRLCGREADAADLTQKTFAKVWSALPSYQARSKFSTWIHGIAHHVYVDWCRRPRRTEPREEAWWQAQADQAASPLESLAERDRAEQIYALVEKMDEDARQAVHLHYYQGLTLDETAEVLAIAASTVKYRLRRALDFLRRHVSENKSIPN